MNRDHLTDGTKREGIVLWIAFAFLFFVFLRAFYIQILQHDFLTKEADKRQVRIVKVPASRGEIFDRNGDLLALSTPVSDIWANPSILIKHSESISSISKILKISDQDLRLKLETYSHKKFMYLKRHVLPDVADELIKQGILGVYVKRAYKRYYPAGSVMANVVGYTNIDDEGQDGIEYVYNNWLKGKDGRNKAIKNLKGNIIKIIDNIQDVKKGQSITLSVDKDIQYFVYRALKRVMIKHQANSAAAVVLDAKSGEVLALASLPGYNPNDRSQLTSYRTRNRVVTDLMEPGSTIKPFIIAEALDLGLIDLTTKINTSPGFLNVLGSIISDSRDYGILTPEGIIKHSSNIGSSKIAFKMTPKQQWSIYNKLGFSHESGLFLPGEINGFLKPHQSWSKLDQASASFGYGLSVNLIKLANAYLVLANHGKMFPVTLIKRDKPIQNEDIHQVFSANSVNSVLQMMKTVVHKNGTAPKAAIPGYSIAGKTGTVHKTKIGGYEENEYLSSFVGIVPASNPNMVMVVAVNKPSRGVYYGGQVAAPVFKEVMTEALRLRHVSFDKTSFNDKTLHEKR